MKIVHVITRLIIGGAQENTLLTCLEQSRLGHEVTLLTGPPLGPEGSLLDAARAMPLRTVLVPPLRRAVRPWHDLPAYGDLLKHFRDIHPDVVHTHSSKAGILGRRAARAAGVPCIVHTIHGLAFDAYQGLLANWAYRAAERRAARWSDRLIAVCADMADRAAAAGLAPTPSTAGCRAGSRTIDVVYSAMDLDRFRAAEGRRGEVRSRWAVRPDDFVFIKIARLFHLKGHAFVLPAFAEVARRCPRAVLVLAGEGVLRPHLEAEVRRLGVADRVRFLGLVPPQDVPGLLWAADAVVHAGLREGLARVLPEAGVCRRPVISYNIGGAREVVRDGENGYLLEPPSRDETGAGRFSRGCEKGTVSAGPMAEAMARLASDPAAARQMGERWPAEVLGQFDYRKATRQVLASYDAARRV
jgi:glycosyltransferase involved in cell wall biosynthesis